MRPEVSERIARADLYRLLSLGYRYPRGKDQLGSLAALSDALSRYPLHPLDLREGLRSLAACASEVDPADIQGEYLRLFDTAPSSSPYESSYDPIRKDRILGDVAGFYRAFGLQTSSADAEMPDHFGAELEFLSVVSLKAAYAFDSGKEEMARVCDDAFASFLRDHVGRWFRILAEAVEQGTNLDYFRQLMRLSGLVIEGDLRRMRLQCDPYDTTGDAKPEAVNVACPGG